MRSHHPSNRVCRNCRHLMEAGLQAWNALEESRLRGICQAPPQQGSPREPDCALDDVRPGRPRRRLPNTEHPQGLITNNDLRLVTTTRGSCHAPGLTASLLGRLPFLAERFENPRLDPLAACQKCLAVRTMR